MYNLCSELDHLSLQGKTNSRSSNPRTHSIRGQSALFNRLNKTYLALLVTSKFKVLASL